MNSNEYKLLQNKINYITNETITTDNDLKKVKKTCSWKITKRLYYVNSKYRRYNIMVFIYITQ